MRAARRPALGALVRVGIVSPYTVIHRCIEADGVVTIMRILPCAYFTVAVESPPHAEPTARAPRIRGYAKAPTDGQSVAARVNE